MSDSWSAQKAASLKAKAEQKRIKQETELRRQNVINARATTKNIFGRSTQARVN
jgi:hypothetical protein